MNKRRVARMPIRMHHNILQHWLRKYFNNSLASLYALRVCTNHTHFILRLYYFLGYLSGGRVHFDRLFHHVIVKSWNLFELEHVRDAFSPRSVDDEREKLFENDSDRQRTHVNWSNESDLRRFRFLVKLHANTEMHTLDKILQWSWTNQ